MQSAEPRAVVWHTQSPQAAAAPANGGIITQAGQDQHRPSQSLAAHQPWSLMSAIRRYFLRWRGQGGARCRFSRDLAER